MATGDIVSKFEYLAILRDKRSGWHILRMKLAKKQRGNDEHFFAANIVINDEKNKKKTLKHLFFTIIIRIMLHFVLITSLKGHFHGQYADADQPKWLV